MSKNSLMLVIFCVSEYGESSERGDFSLSRLHEVAERSFFVVNMERVTFHSEDFVRLLRGDFGGDLTK